MMLNIKKAIEMPLYSENVQQSDAVKIILTFWKNLSVLISIETDSIP